MKRLFQLLGLVLLILVALLTISRRENSGAWIIYESFGDGGEGIFLMTGDGQSGGRIFRVANCRGNKQWSPDQQELAFATACDGTLEMLQIGSSIRQLVSIEFPNAYENYWSPDGRRLLVSHDDLELTIIDSDGRSQMLPGFGYRFPQWSPDGEWIYASRPIISNPEASLHRINTRTFELEYLFTTTLTSNFGLSWSPDGAQIVLRATGDLGDRLFLMSPDGSNFSAILIDQQPSYLTSPRWSPDGEWIAFIGGRSFADGSIFRMRPDGRGLLRLAEGLRNIRDLQWSPDGQWLLFQANHEGPEDIYRIRPDGSQLENLTPGPEWGFAPQYGQFPGADWHPFWLTLAAAGLMILSFVRGLRP